MSIVLPNGRLLSLAATAFCLITACSDVTSSSPSGIESIQASSSVPWAGDPELSGILSTARAATAKYHDVSVALADGYSGTTDCKSSPTGAMGMHYANFPLIGDGVIDPAHPEVLLYEPRAHGTPRLVAVEYVVFKLAWLAAHPGQPPTLAGIPFNEAFGPQAHGLPDHYELHVWLWRNNPLGMFESFNPKVSCQP